MRLRVGIGCLALLLAVGCISVSTSPPSPSAEAAGSIPSAGNVSSSAVPPPAAPSSLHADQARAWRADPRSWSIVLTWDPPSGMDPDRYEVERNGRLLEDDLAGTRFVDRSVTPQTEYRYEVTGVDVGGLRTEAAAVKIETDAPPLADARLEGRFAMRMHITGQSGLQGGASGGGMLFLYDPACARGPCDVIWSRKGRVGSGRLSRDDANYDGTVFASFQIGSCQGGSLTETLAFTTRVVEADVVQGEWRATKIQGTLHESAAGSGCVTAVVDWTFTGFLQA